MFRRPAGNVIALDGWIYGTLAIHSTWDDPANKPAVTITHWPSRLAVAHLDDVDEAVAQVEWLWDVCPLAWVDESVDLTRVPAEVIQWAKEHR